MPWINAKKFDWSNFHQRNTTKTQRNRSISEANHHGRWKMGKRISFVKDHGVSNRKGIVFHHDNARPYTSLMTRQKLRELDWEVLMHPPYRPCTVWLPFVLISAELSWWKNIGRQKSCRKSWKSFSPINHRSSTRMELWNYLKNGKRL